MNDLIPIEYKSQRIMTTKVLAEQFGTEEKNVQMNFANNEGRFVIGKHYYKLDGDELREFKQGLPNDIREPLKYAPILILWTDRGAARHAKILETDEAWQVYEGLEETYFRVKEGPQTQIQILQNAVNILAEQEKQLLETKALALEAKKESEQVNSKLDTIKDTFAELPQKQWRKWVNDSIGEIGVKNGFKDIEYENMKSDSYKLLEEKAGANLNTKLRNGKKRLEEAGATKTAIKGYCKLDCIEEDKRLKEIYTGVIKELRLKYLV